MIWVEFFACVLWCLLMIAGCTRIIWLLCFAGLASDADHTLHEDDIA